MPLGVIPSLQESLYTCTAMYDAIAFDGLYESPLGWLGIRLQGNSLIHLDWLGAAVTTPVTGSDFPLVGRVTECLDRYFQSGSAIKNIPLSPPGTPFQKRVWEAIRAIPAGTTRTYGELAAELNTSSRAIGQACRSNPIPIFIPCHRVVAANGIGGFMGKSSKIHIKQWLLHHEGIH